MEEVVYKVLLYLSKVYDLIYRECCIDIIVVYGVGPWMECLLRRYWDILAMVDQLG